MLLPVVLFTYFFPSTFNINFVFRVDYEKQFFYVLWLGAVVAVNLSIKNNGLAEYVYIDSSLVPRTVL